MKRDNQTIYAISGALLVIVLTLPVLYDSLLYAARPKHPAFVVPVNCMRKIDLRECKVTDGSTMVCKKVVVSFSCISYDNVPVTNGQLPIDRIKQEKEPSKDAKQ